jgi:SAM-dependent methyltransferase
VTVQPDWYRTFFSGVAVDFWLQATNDEQTRQEADFIEQQLQLAPGAKVLDAPCGGGRHSLALAARGFHLTGIDVSADFLNAARAGAAARQLAVVWEQRDMRDLPWPEAFDGVFCFGNSFGYLDDAGHAAFLRAVHGTLMPGARFVLDAPALEMTLPLFASLERTWASTGDILFLQQRRYDPAEGRVESDYTFVRDGRVEKCTALHRMYTYRELFRMLADAGFAEVQGHGSLAREPFQLGSRRLLLTARKPG